MPRADSYAERVESLREFIARIFAEDETSDSDELSGFGAMLAAVVADGWPEAMARAGLELHRETWRVDELSRAIEAELGALGGIAALESGAGPYRIIKPESIVHIWPALPGAGLTPVLFGALLGVPQWVRPSRRGRNFAEFVARYWPTEIAPLKLLQPDDSWRFADVVVVSGSDETVAHIRRRVEDDSDDDSSGIPTIVTGYGHRVSFAVVVDGEGVELQQTAAKIAFDTVMWHQMGCFSPRAVLFKGSPARLEELGARLGEAIAAEESRLDARELNSAELARRAQALGVAEFTTTIWGSGVGWVQICEDEFRGERVSAHTLTLHPLESLERLDEVLAVAPQHIQGVALQAPDDEYERWAQALSKAGATRICAPGKLQAPPAGWPHDGRPNTLEWLRATLL
jgi:hypothetical protein